MAAVLSYLLGSAVAFGLTLGAVAFMREGGSSPLPGAPLAPTFALSLMLYAATYWLMLAVVTFPVFVLPLAALALAVRIRPSVATRRLRSAALVVAIAAVGMVVRAAMLEYRTLLSNPSVFATGFLIPYWACELFAFSVGLLCASYVGFGGPRHMHEVLEEGRP